MNVDSLRLRYAGRRDLGRGGKVLAWGLIAGVHAAALGGAMWRHAQSAPARTPPPMMVSFIVEQAPPPQVQPLPPPPKPRLERAEPKPQMVATTEPTPSPMTAPPLQDVPVDVVETPPQPAPPAPVIPPNFVAAYLNNPAPSYPYLSKQRHESGTVMLKVLVSAAGRAERVLVERSSGFPRLDEAAAEVVQRRWRFVPAKQGEEAIAAWVLIPMIFELKK